MRKLVLMLALACLPVLRANAQTVTLSGQGTLLDGRLPYFPGAGFTTGALGFSAVLPTSPTPPNSSLTNNFLLYNVKFVFTQSGKNPWELTGNLTVFGNNPYHVGGWLFSAPFQTGYSAYIDGYSARIFTGLEDAPTFTPGTYNYENASQIMSLSSFTIAETPSTTVPEPSTALLMASGLAALGVVARRRRRA
jgi:hypothetical protein